MIVLTVIGLPMSQGSKTAMPGKNGGRPWLIDAGTKQSRERQKSWRSRVADAAAEWLKEHPAAPLDEPVKVSMVFRFPLPKSDRYRQRHRSKPDLSKLARLVEDALVDAKLLTDDAIIWTEPLRKIYTEWSPGVEIRIFPQGVAEARYREEAKKLVKAQRASNRNPV